MTKHSVAQLPALDDHYPLTAAQIDAFQRDGHLLLRGVARPDEVEVYRSVLNDAVDRYNTETRPLEQRDTYGKAFLQIMNLWVRDEGCRRFVMAHRFARIAAELLQADAVRLYHDQALYKEPGGGHTPWHQDQYYWPLDTGNALRCVTLWMPLVDVPIELGALTFASGSHREGFLGHMEISDTAHTQFEQHVRESGYRLSTEPMRAGDATFHAGWTLHAAPGNAGNVRREVMTIIYYADGLRAMEPDNPNRQNDLETWLPGVRPGALAASPLNPVLYRRS